MMMMMMSLTGLHAHKGAPVVEGRAVEEAGDKGARQ